MRKLSVIEGSSIKIEKGIPYTRRAGSREVYPFGEMSVGDSFLFPKGYADAHYYGMAREATNQALLRGENKKFRASKTPDGYRCWRVE